MPTPASGTGVGMGTLKLNGPCDVVAGVAPLASIWVLAKPVRFGSHGAIAPAAWRGMAGRFTTVW